MPSVKTKPVAIDSMAKARAALKENPVARPKSSAAKVPFKEGRAGYAATEYSLAPAGRKVGGPNAGFIFNIQG